MKKYFEKFHFSIRMRMIALIGGAVALSLGCYLYVGSQLVIQDKTSYIYDYSFSQVRLASMAIQSEIAKVFAFRERIQNQNIETINAIFNAEKASLLANYLVLLRKTDSKKYEVVTEIGIKTSTTPLPWPSQIFSQFPVKLEVNLSNQTYTLGLKTSQTQAMVIQMKFAHPLFEGTAKDFQILIAEHSGKIIAAKNSDFESRFKVIPKEVLQPLSQSEFTTGVREAQFGDQYYLMGYDQILSNNFLIMSLVPTDMAFVAARTLAKKSIGLGISIFLLAIGSTLLLIRNLLVRVQELVRATERVAEGDFSSKIIVNNSFQDEVTSLALSFNRMGEEIQKLIIATAMSARMEQELETAQLVQSRFFPPKFFKSPTLHLVGSSINASECGGDWWHYAQVQDYLVIIMGDATGHGASAALITASVHSAFSIIMEELKLFRGKIDPSEQILGRLMRSLNAALILTAGEFSTFPCLAAVMNLKTLQLWLSNAGHPIPYLFRHGTKSYEGIAATASIPLGQKAYIYDPTPTIVDLHPGDQLLWYTDGLFDTRLSDGKKMKKKDLMNLLKVKADGVLKASMTSQQSLADLVLDQANQFFGENASNRPDDITVISISIPLSAATSQPKAA